MEVINEDFNIPFYLFEEILDYVMNGKPSSSWPNLYCLIKIAEKNNRFTEYQTNRLAEILQPDKNKKEVAD